METEISHLSFFNWHTVGKITEYDRLISPSHECFGELVWTGLWKSESVFKMLTAKFDRGIMFPFIEQKIISREMMTRTYVLDYICVFEDLNMNNMMVGVCKKCSVDSALLLMEVCSLDVGAFFQHNVFTGDVWCAMFQKYYNRATNDGWIELLVVRSRLVNNYTMSWICMNIKRKNYLRRDLVARIARESEWRGEFMKNQIMKWIAS